MLLVSPKKTRSGFRDRRGGVGPNGKSSFPRLGAAATRPIVGNGDSNPPDCGIPVQRAEDEREKVCTARSRWNWYVDMTGKRLLLGVHFKHPSGFLLVGLAELCLLHVLRDRVEQIALAQGLNRVSLECANALNQGLDSYITGFCLDLAKPNSSARQKQKVLSLQEFRVAMELNLRQLGEDWPLLLEKICAHEFEE
ncbi:uncharacterized protein LOC121778951 [Salvia splendens]|uniref:uncharacterized protein LOC121778951 n=1 Tax=Salvia splendens TaxID=180675 RepID=UPI001C27C73E|nr:uncharacterized protein LOC121778951 [Salvia splendens]